MLTIRVLDGMRALILRRRLPIPSILQTRCSTGSPFVCVVMAVLLRTEVDFAACFFHKPFNQQKVSSVF
jgi:hypothetical protein